MRRHGFREEEFVDTPPKTFLAMSREELMTQSRDGLAIWNALLQDVEVG